MTAPQLAAGQVVAGKYSIRGLLQHGGLTATYHATAASRRDVALKLYDPSLKASVDLLSVLRRHEVATNALPDNWAMHILETGEESAPGCIFSATEFSIHPSLAKLIEMRPLSPPEAVALLRNLARVIDLAHSAKLAHLGLKPTNLFVGPAPAYDVRVADFGLHGIRAGRQAADPIVSWLGWIAPEQLAGAGGASADVFSAALVTFFAMTGRSYWRASQRGAVDPAAWDVERRGSRTPVSARAAEFSAMVPPSFDAPFARALAEGPGERFSSVGAFAESLVAALEGRPIAPATMPRRLESLNATVRFGGQQRNPPGRSGLLKSTLIGIPMPGNTGPAGPEGARAAPGRPSPALPTTQVVAGASAGAVPRPPEPLTPPRVPGGAGRPQPAPPLVAPAASATSPLMEAARAAMVQAGVGGPPIVESEMAGPNTTPLGPEAIAAGTAFTQPAPMRMAPSVQPAPAAAPFSSAARVGQPPAAPYGLPQEGAGLPRGQPLQPDVRERGSIAERYAMQEGPLAATISVADRGLPPQLQAQVLAARAALPSNAGVSPGTSTGIGPSQGAHLGSGLPGETLPSFGGPTARGGTFGAAGAPSGIADTAVASPPLHPRQVSASPLAGIVAAAASEAAGIAESSAQAPLMSDGLPIESPQTSDMVRPGGSVRPARPKWMLPVLIGLFLGIGVLLLFALFMLKGTPSPGPSLSASSPAPSSASLASEHAGRLETVPTASAAPPASGSPAESAVPVGAAPVAVEPGESPIAAETASGAPSAQADTPPRPQPAEPRPQEPPAAVAPPAVAPPAVAPPAVAPPAVAPPAVAPPAVAPPATQAPAPAQAQPAASAKKCGKFLKRCP